jgi:hypothetical protein
VVNRRFATGQSVDPWDYRIPDADGPSNKAWKVSGGKNSTGGFSGFFFFGPEPEAKRRPTAVREMEDEVRHRWKVLGTLLALLGFLIPPPSGQAETSDLGTQVQRQVREAIAIQQDTQKSEAGWREERERLLAAYESLRQNRERLKAQNQVLAEQTAAAEARVAARQTELAAVEEMAARVQPFVENLIRQLARIIEEDLPFLAAERRQRLERLQALQNDPQVTASEKLRKVFEALLVETEYGHTIEVSQETVTVAGSPILANIFRLGRLGLYYQSLDHRSCGFYNIATAAWQPLDDGENRTLQNAIEIGAKQRPVQLLAMPIGRIQPR